MNTYSGWKKQVFPNVGVTMLVDPWLVGELTFYGQTWAFTGRKGDLPPVDVDAVAAKADIIVITQVLPALCATESIGLKDHAEDYAMLYILLNQSCTMRRMLCQPGG